MGIKRSLSIQKKVIFLSIVSLVAIQGAFGVYTVYLTKTKLHYELLVSKERIVSELCRMLPTPLWNFDFETTRELIHAKFSEQIFKGLKIIDIKSGDTVATVFKDSLVSAASLKSSLVFTGDFIRDGKPYWRGFFHFSDAGIRQTIKKSILSSMLSTLALSLVLWSVLTWIIKSQVITPLKGSVEMLEHIAKGEGDLTRRLHIASYDELGLLSYWFNCFIDTLRSIIINFKGSIDTVTNTSKTMSRCSDDLAGNSRNLTQRSASLTDSMGGMRESMNLISSSVKNTSGSLSEISEASNRLLTSINEISQAIETANTSSSKAVACVNASEEFITALDEKTSAITTIIETIVDIVEQTKLLALNAAIEASHAGTAGNGFQVVADEIKTLALHSSSELSSIKENISDIHESTHQSIAGIKKIHTIINEVNDKITSIAHTVSRQKNATQEIVGSTQHASEGMNTVVHGISQAVTMTDSIFKDIQYVHKEGAHIEKESKQIKSNERELTDLMNVLGDLVGRFKI